MSGAPCVLASPCSAKLHFKPFINTRLSQQRLHSVYQTLLFALYLWLLLKTALHELPPWCPARPWLAGV